MASVWGEEISEEELNDPRACALLPLDGLYFDRRIAGEADDFPIGSATLTYSLLSVAMLIILIALINFVNFFFALVPVRLRAVNILKVFGPRPARCGSASCSRLSASCSWHSSVPGMWPSR